MTAPELPPESPREGAARTYRAFISYSHRDAREAAWLHRALERYALPRHLVGSESPIGPVPARLHPVFLDRAELAATADLDAVLLENLRRSDTLIVVCSPDAAASPRVAREIELFLSFHSADRVLAFIVAGRPNAAERGMDAAEECFPAPLRSTVLGRGPDHARRDPLAADIRPGHGGRDEAVLKLVAGILRIDLDALRQRDAQRRRRRWAAGLAASLAGMSIASALGIYAWQQRAEAVRQARTAQATSDFIVNLFEAADPAKALGRTLLARTVVDQGFHTASTSLRQEPAVQRRLLRTIGSIYNNLGLYADAERALRQSAGIDAKSSSMDADERARTSVALASALANLDKYDEAIALTTGALPQFGDSPDSREARISAQSFLGFVYWRAGRPKDALSTLVDARERALRFSGPRTELMAGILEDLGRSRQSLGELEAGLKLQREAAEIRKAVLGPDNFWYGNSLNNIGFALAWLGRFDEAAASFSDAETLFRRVLGPRHPWVGISLYGRGTALRDLGRYPDALALLTQAQELLSAPDAGGNVDQLDLEQVLGSTYGALERFDRALPLLKSVTERTAKKFGADSPPYANALYAYAGDLHRSGRTAEAIPLLRRTLEIQRAALGEGYDASGVMRLGLADALCAAAPNAEGFAIATQIAADRAKEAMAWRRHAATGMAAYCDPDPTRRATNEQALLAAVTTFETMRGASSTQTRWMVRRLVRFYEAAGRKEEAATWRGRLGTRFALPADSATDRRGASG